MSLHAAASMVLLAWSVPPFAAGRIGAPELGLVASLMPLGLWCNGEGQVVLVIKNRGAATQTFTVLDPSTDPAEWPESYSFGFTDASGRDLPNSSRGRITTADCDAAHAASCFDEVFRVVLPPGAEIAWTIPVYGAPTDRKQFDLKVEVSVSDGPPGSPMVDLGPSLPLETSGQRNGCWQVRRSIGR